jgi:preprotein translocase subunit SecA
MLNLLTKGIAKIFGTKSGRDIKIVAPLVDTINEEFQKLQDVSDDELRGKTAEIKSIIDENLKNIDGEIASLHQKVAENPELDIHEKETIFNSIDKLEEERNKELEEILLKVLPEAFAVVKETARRFKESGQLKVNANYYDKELAANHSNVTI